MEFILIWLGMCLAVDIIWYLIHGSWPYGGRGSGKK